MARFGALLFCSTAVLVERVAGFEALHEDFEALSFDDACLADSSSEECSLSLRQLRGQRAADLSLEVDKANSSGDVEAFCCYAAKDSSNPCSTCLPTAMSAADSECNSKDKCGGPGCGGSWCKSVCSMGAADKSDMCGTAYLNGIATTDKFCSESAKDCSACHGEWCSPKTKAADQIAALDEPEQKHIKISSVKGGSSGFCCYAGASLKDTCGTCYPNAKATDEEASSETGCATLGGTWCATACATAAAESADASNVSFFKEDSFCAKTEAACTENCQGSFTVLNHSVAQQMVAQANETSSGFCCYAGSSKTDTCGTCYPEARATDSKSSTSKGCSAAGGTWCATACMDKPSKLYFPADSYCGDSEENCKGTCKSSWTVLDHKAEAKVTALKNSTTPNTGFCCYAGASSKDVCGTCYPSAMAVDEECMKDENGCSDCGGSWCAAQCVASDSCSKAEDVFEADSFCAKSKQNCDSTCKGSWCVADNKKSAAVEKPKNKTTTGFCCYDSPSAKDMCGTCYENARATDDTCSLEANCGQCGGTWCAATCVAAKDSCGAEHEVYTEASFCSESEDQCENQCQGSWCVKNHNLTNHKKLKAQKRKKAKKSTNETASGDDDDDADDEDDDKDED
eukprot:TRINITY_DN6531_c3_g2_i1.p1 TRINITY_DN6531_c3_g2~~TRINITY_DN6531_c3_g2_i1.p1  ORF type:complete len:628 (+),score=158.80 TRINITY_DN6531_c3_g2_i1:134-2017(+)